MQSKAGILREVNALCRSAGGIDAAGGMTGALKSVCGKGYIEGWRYDG